MMLTQSFYFFRTLIFIFATLMLFKYFLFMVIAPFYSIQESLRRLRIIKMQLKNPQQKPFLISVIIPAWNEEVGVLKTVASILANDYQHVEIVIVNDGSRDNTDEVVRSFLKKYNQEQHHQTIQYIAQENGGKGKALNSGIKHSHGDIMLTMDADSAISPEGLKHLVSYFYDDEISAVVGNVKVSDNDSIVGFIQRLEYLFGFYFKRTHAVLGAEYIFGGACAAFRKNVFEELGLFDEVNKTEDIEMSMRVRFHGMKCTYAEDVVCYTEGASTIKGLVNQRLRWKKGRFDTFIKYRNMFWSTDLKHNKALTFFILPYTLLSEMQLFFEPLGITLLLSYSFISGDFLSLTLGILFIFAIYLVNALFHHEGVNLKLLLLFPASWILFYFLIWVEYLALWHSIRMILRGDNIQWQKWERKGIKELT